MPQSRRPERPRSSRSEHSSPGGVSCLSSASVAQMLAAASIKVMDALFVLVARNDAEWSIGESFWDAHGVEIGACAIFADFPDPEIIPVPENAVNYALGCSIMDYVSGNCPWKDPGLPIPVFFGDPRKCSGIPEKRRGLEDPMGPRTRAAHQGRAPEPRTRSPKTCFASISTP